MMLVIFFKKNFCLGQVDHFEPKNDASSLLWIRCKNFFLILHNEKGQYVDESNNGLYQKFCSGQIRLFWAQKWHILITLDWL